MLSSFRIFRLISVLGVIASASTVQAQIKTTLRLSKSQYVAHEPVQATVTITNHAGRDLLIHTEGQGAGAFNWLDFVIKNSNGTSMSPLKRVSFRPVTIPAGRSISRTVDLTGIYRVTEVGNFRCHAVVRLPGGGGNFTSNSVLFNVTRGQQVFSQRVGDPATRNVREYRLSIHNSSKKSMLYVHVVDVRTGRTLQAFRLGELLTFKRPKATVDRHSNLHVLFLATPRVYAHSRVTPDGKFLGTQYYNAAPGAKPALATFANGDVFVSGGIVYDPDAAKEQRAQIRRLSERPGLTYR